MRQVINSVYAITLLFSLFALMPAVYGLTIHVNAIPNTDVYVAVLEADKSYTPIETFTKNSGETGTDCRQNQLPGRRLFRVA